MGGWHSSLVAATNLDGRVEVFGIGSDLMIYHNYQSTPNGAFQTSWSTIGNWTALGLCVGQNADGRLQIFTVGTDNQCNTVAQTAPNAGWGSWSHLGGWHTALAVGKNSDGRLELFDIGSGKNIFHNWQSSANGSFQTSWGQLGTWTGYSVAVGRNLNGFLQVFVVGTDNQCNSIAQISGGWGSWSHLGGSITTIAVAANSDGRLELFGESANRQMYHSYQSTPNGSFGGWSSLGGNLK